MAEQEHDLSMLSDKIDLSPEGMLNHNLGVLQAVASIAATVGHHVQVKLRPNWELGDQYEFVLSGTDGVWIVFTYEEALEFLVELANEKSREVCDGTKN